jgi:hypothetical protein
MSLEEKCCVAIWKKSVGLSLNDRETAALIKVVREAFMDEEKKDTIGTFEQAVDLILAELRAVMISKQKDYGPRNILDCGEIGVLIRANDKLARLRNLYGITDGTFTRKVSLNESMDDSWTDLANYAIIAKMLRRGIFGLRLSNGNDPSVKLKAQP